MDEDPTGPQLTRAETTLQNSIKSIQKRFEEALEKDNQETTDTSGTLSSVAAGLIDKVKK